MTQHDSTSHIVVLDAQSPVPLFRQIYYGLRDGILVREFAPGSRLPSTRRLALDLGVARLTVQNAYEQLIAEGYARGEHGSGTYVSTTLPGPAFADTAIQGASSRLARANRRLARRGADWLSLARVASTTLGDMTENLAFRADLPALDLFPSQLWGRFLGRRWRNSSGNLLSATASAGYPPLRTALADYLTAERGLRCTPDQIIIVNGVQQVINLAAYLLLDPSDKVWLEDPGQPAVQAALVRVGARPCPVPVDGDGINVAAGLLTHADARLAVVTPAHQWPTAVVMTLPRRLALLEWASRAGAWVVEDDRGGAFYYAEHPVAPLFALDQQQRVLHAGAFNQLLFPALQLGYLVAPTDLVEPLLQLKRLVSAPSSQLEQAVLADFIAGGHLTYHLRRARSAYQERQTWLLAACRDALAEQIEVQPARSGLHLLGWLPPGVDDRKVAEQAASYQVALAPLSAYRLTPGERGALLLGYGATPVAQIPPGVDRLAQLLRQ